YQSTPHIVNELKQAAHFLEGLGHYVEWVVPETNLHAAYEAQTKAYIMKFAQTITDILEDKGLERPSVDLVEPICIAVWEEGRFASYTERARMQAVFNQISREMG